MANRPRSRTEEELVLPLDVDRARAETPGCRSVVHLNNAGASLPPQPVLDAVIDHLRLEASIGGYEAAADQGPAIEHAYDAVATLLGARREEIALVENATRAWDMAFYALPLEPDDPSGELDVEALRGLLDERVKLIAINHVPTHNGLVNPAAEIGKVAREAGVPYLLDACQSVGQMPVDVAEIGCDLLSATGRKFLRGPRGTGFLFVSERVLERLDPPFLDLHAADWTAPDEYVVRPDARRFESWESSLACRVGLGAAVDYALGFGLDAVQERVTGLAAGLRERLRAIPGVTVHDRGERLCGIVTFSVAGHEAGEVAAALSRQRINVSQSRPEAARYDFEARGLPALVRASAHYYNTEDELEALARVVEAL